MDRNIILAEQLNRAPPSLSARRAWIEILSRDVDGAYLVVALRKESVDRNFHAVQVVVVIVVALRKESVDRNYYADKDADWVRVSLSARRAWIEIVYPGTWSGSILVALRKESVDRNLT